MIYDAVVIGGGFYGASIAINLAEKFDLSKVLLIERESALLTRASRGNQARIHGGYHYPRSFTTAYRSRINSPIFRKAWPTSVAGEVDAFYAISCTDSKVNFRQFERFCSEIGAPLEAAPREVKNLFNSRRVSEVYRVNEHVFDYTQLALWAENELARLGIPVRFNTKANLIGKRQDHLLETLTTTPDGTRDTVVSKYVFNCTYSGLNSLGGDFPGTTASLKHEIAEMPLVKTPAILRNVGITVMDGAYFSLMPYPARPGLHTLSHVRYTPHMAWLDAPTEDPYSRLDSYTGDSRFDRMRRDAMKFLPILSQITYVDSIREVKTVLQQNENDDGRPILFEEYSSLENMYSVLGGKVDNIFDIIQQFESLKLSPIEER